MAGLARRKVGSIEIIIIFRKAWKLTPWDVNIRQFIHQRINILHTSINTVLKTIVRP